MTILALTRQTSNSGQQFVEMLENAGSQTTRDVGGWVHSPVPAPMGEGSFQRLELQHGFELSLGRFQLVDGFAIEVAVEEPAFSFACVLRGNLPWTLPGQSRPHRDGDGAILWAGGETLRFRAAHTLPVHTLSMMVTAQFLRDKLSRPGLPMSRQLEAALLREGEPSFLRTLPLTAAARSAATEIVQAAGDPLGPLVAESCALTILHEQLRCLFPAAGRSEQRLLRKGDLERLHEVKRILSKHPERSPRLGELARMVATNEWSLKRGFRAAFGMSVYEFLRQQRMTLADRMLTEDLSVAVVAGRVGYNCPSRFAVAFRKHFGVSPRDRKLGRA